MTENSSPSRFKAEMPQIPGVTVSSAPRRNPMLPLVLGALALAVLLFVASRWVSHFRPPEPPRSKPAPQIEVPPPPPDPSTLVPHADAASPAIAQLGDLSKPWSSLDFFIRNQFTGENVPATVVRLPTGSRASPLGYWAFSRRAPYGSCELEYLTDLAKIRTDYDYRYAAHPLVGNPCSRTLYDPLKTSSLQGNVFVRGAIVQGSDLRPPLGVELKIQGKQILAIRTE